MSEEVFPSLNTEEPEAFAYAILDGDNVVTGITLSTPAYAATQGWILALNAQIGDTWDGTQFITPPPPPPTIAQYNAMLSAKLAAREQVRRANLRDAIINSTVPPINTEQGFLDAMETWDWDA